MARVSTSTREHRGVVAVIEDDVSLNQAIIRQLEAAGYRTCSFKSGEEVLSASGRIADCFVMDVHLPNMTGFEVLRRLGASAPIIVITAHDDPMHRRAAKAAHAVAYLTKPIAREALLEAVTRALANRTP
jgi:FixJ family two-component response regulator